MSEPITVSVVLPSGDEDVAGVLRATNVRRTESATFTYAPEYLANPRSYPIDPDLPLVDWPIHTAHRALFRCMEDSTPDRWGRALLDRKARGIARLARQHKPTMLEIDYLLGVRDDVRQGALRFARANEGPVAVDNEAVPRIVALESLLALTDDMLRDPNLDEDLRDLIAAGSSLGGARPKASVIDDDGELLIAKFPKADSDNWDVPSWEKLTLDLAGRAGITVPDNRLIRVANRNVLLLKRFDRVGARRVGYISAITLTQTSDGVHTVGQVDVADFLEPLATDPDRDLPQLFRRALFGLLVSNTDNHLRNIGFLRHETGWELSPAFDINPNPEPSVFATTVGSGGAEPDSIADALDWAEYFRLTSSEALDILAQIVDSTAAWRRAAKALDINPAEISRMIPAFESSRTIEARQLITGH